MKNKLKMEMEALCRGTWIPQFFCSRFVEERLALNNQYIDIQRRYNMKVNTRSPSTIYPPFLITFLFLLLLYIFSLVVGEIISSGQFRMMKQYGETRNLSRKLLLNRSRKLCFLYFFSILCFPLVQSGDGVPRITYRMNCFI